MVQHVADASRRFDQDLALPVRHLRHDGFEGLHHPSGRQGWTTWCHGGLDGFPSWWKLRGIAHRARTRS